MFEKYLHQFRKKFWTIVGIMCALGIAILFSGAGETLSNLVSDKSGWTSVFVVLIFGGGTFLIQYKINGIQNKMSLNDRYRKHKTWFLAKLVVIQLAAFWFLIIFYNSDFYLWVYGLGITLLMLAANYPTKKKLIRDLQLTASELEI